VNGRFAAIDAPAGAFGQEVSSDSQWRRAVHLITLLLIGAAGFILICAFLYLGQERSIFFPQANDPQLRQQYSAQRIECATTAMRAWRAGGSRIRKRPRPPSFFTSAATPRMCSTPRALRQASTREPWSSSIPQLRRQHWRAGQQALYDDGLALYDYAITRGVPPSTSS
jgi:hypothetical protein